MVKKTYELVVVSTDKSSGYANILETKVFPLKNTRTYVYSWCDDGTAILESDHVRIEWTTVVASWSCEGSIGG